MENSGNLIFQKCGHPDVGLLLKIPLQTDTCNNKKRSHTQLDSRKQVIAFQDRVITIYVSFSLLEYF